MPVCPSQGACVSVPKPRACIVFRCRCGGCRPATPRGAGRVFAAILPCHLPDDLTCLPRMKARLHKDVSPCLHHIIRFCDKQRRPGHLRNREFQSALKETEPSRRIGAACRVFFERRFAVPVGGARSSPRSLLFQARPRWPEFRAKAPPPLFHASAPPPRPRPGIPMYAASALSPSTRNPHETTPRHTPPPRPACRGVSDRGTAQPSRHPRPRPLRMTARRPAPGRRRDRSRIHPRLSAQAPGRHRRLR